MEPIRWICVLFAALMITSCASYKTESRMHSIELGMSKAKVVSILGKDYEIVGAGITSEGAFEKISYAFSTMGVENGYYVLSFKDGVLVEWLKEKRPVNCHQNQNWIK